MNQELEYAVKLEDEKVYLANLSKAYFWKLFSKTCR